MSFRRYYFPFAFILLLGVSAPSRTEALRDAWLLHLPGIGGHMRVDDLVTTGLRDAGIAAGENGKIEIYDWTGPDRGMAALAQVKRHQAQSKIVADMILKHAREFPNQPIVLTSHSAGTGIAVWALERLPDDVMIDDLVMMASALSPQFDLTKALRHVKHKAYAFNSELDLIVLGTGTKLFGTVDRVLTEAAGRVGFTMPAGGDPVQYEKLVQYPYDSDWMRFNNDGEHIGAMMRPFARNVIAKVLEGTFAPPKPTTRPSTRPTSQPTTNP